MTGTIRSMRACDRTTRQRGSFSRRLVIGARFSGSQARRALADERLFSVLPRTADRPGEPAEWSRCGTKQRAESRSCRNSFLPGVVIMPGGGE